jgi:hypothetical protein
MFCGMTPGLESLESRYNQCVRCGDEPKLVLDFLCMYTFWARVQWYVGQLRSVCKLGTLPTVPHVPGAVGMFGDRSRHMSRES